jgi:hypothetical protein
MLDKKIIIGAVIVLLALVAYMCMSKTEEAFQDKGPLKELKVVEVTDMKASDYIIYQLGGVYVQVDKIYYYNADNSIVFMGYTNCAKTQTLFVKITQGNYANAAAYAYDGLWVGSRLPDPGQLTQLFGFGLTRKNCLDSFAKIDPVTDRTKLDNMAKFYMMGFIPTGNCAITGGLPVSIPVKKIYVVKDEDNKENYVAFAGTFTDRKKHPGKIFIRVVKRDIATGVQSVWEYTIDEFNDMDYTGIKNIENIETIDYRGGLQKAKEQMFVTKNACL